MPEIFKSSQKSRKNAIPGVALVAGSEFNNVPEAQKEQWAALADGIRAAKFLEPDGNPNTEWRLFYGKNWYSAMYMALSLARGNPMDSARDAALGASGAAVRGTERDAAWVSTWNAIREIARDAAMGTVKEMARTLPWGAERGAELSALLKAAGTSAVCAGVLSDCIITHDMNVKDKERHMSHAKARWEVWNKGYGLLCDVEGVLYVYAKKSEGPEDIYKSIRR